MLGKYAFQITKQKQLKRNANQLKTESQVMAICNVITFYSNTVVLKSEQKDF